MQTISILKQVVRIMTTGLLRWLVHKPTAAADEVTAIPHGPSLLTDADAVCLIYCRKSDNSLGVVEIHIYMFC
jgi:hypothetical protein